MIRKKDLLDKNARLSEENDILRKVQREHEELESFIAWLNDLCLRKKYQFCGIRKITFNHSRQKPCYIGFVLENILYLEPQKHYSYTLYGYLSTAKRSDMPTPAYTAFLMQQYSEPLIGITNELELIDNRIPRKDLRREGIGSAGMSIIKELAKHLHCTLITGQKEAEEDTPKSLAELTAFYDAHGFDQDDHSNCISFDMKNYKAPKFEVSENN